MDTTTDEYWDMLAENDDSRVKWNYDLDTNPSIR